VHPADARLDALLGDGAAAFRAAFGLAPEPVSLLWAIRDQGGRITDFETGYANPAMAEAAGVTLAEGAGRRLVAEQPEFHDDAVFRRLCGVLETGHPSVVEHRVDSGSARWARCAGWTSIGRSRSVPTR
jgi:PAS domain-containing protein